ncbi:uncharacterized protein LOC129724447 isoform X1 [Wyeomyia smithii]|uniref:uncharacterized protein LOC129724447 isoform X1 n=1 Tax=Wyeomyia smithii TaxID=174621 RepID=UPI002467FD5B|nr:uncharacterized protein LOC129724447 isoform X1 [Wyeomyia smithii]XP_055535343.1 uncharacterized protein LOC129724447 isoform X1 [Wyeomyia smithii]XP_055535344.1 uncharacterized protein LOC129724447 isoform X1 [Wyeomyia smithii]XP_055535345.1 uncharacterized protein LOC129724447 isoform X1 [Wyeomyia smithii]
MNLQDNNCKQQEALEETPEAHIDVEYLIEEDPPNNCDQEEDPFAVNEIPEQVPDYPKASNLSKYIEGFITDDSTWDTAGLPEESDEEAEVKRFCFQANYFVKKYTRHKNGVCINEKTNVPEQISGNSLAEVLECIWNVVEPHLCREIDVNKVDGIKVSWAAKEKPDIRDIHNSVHLRDAKRKTMIRLNQLGEGKIMLHCEGKTACTRLKRKTEHVSRHVERHADLYGATRVIS